VSGDSGGPLRVGGRDGKTSASVETPCAIEECRSRGREGVQGIVGDRKASRRRTWGRCLEKGLGVVPLVPRPCAVRQELEAWGQQHPALPLVGAKPGRTKDEEPRRWHGHSVLRQVAGEDSAGRVAQEEGRFVVGHASQLAQQQAQRSASVQGKAVETVAEQVRHVPARWCACLSAAAAAIAA